jgi:hypothetical protein
MTIYKRKGKDGSPFGSYRICVYLGKKKNGKKLYHWETFDGPIHKARERQKQIEGEILSGKYIKPSKITLSEYMDKWLSDYVEPKLAPRTWEGYESITRVHI